MKLILMAIIFAAGIVWYVSNTTYRETPIGEIDIKQTESKESVDSSHPLSIASLRQMQFESEIIVERKVRETDKFISSVVSYSSEGLKLYALMNVPKGTAPVGGWPVVVVNHGYIPPDVYSTENSYINTSAYFANAGFLVLKPDYRGHDESEGEAGSLQARIKYGVDVLNLIAGIKKLDFANGSNIFMYGHSMGGDVTLRVLEVCGDCVKAATLWAPAVTDWPESSLYFSRKSDQERLARLQKQLVEFITEDEYAQVSTLENIDLIQVPVIIHHGTKDESVPYDWGVKLNEKLREKGKESQLYTYPGDNHDIAGNWGVALGRDVEFFRKF